MGDDAEKKDHEIENRRTERAESNVSNLSVDTDIEASPNLISSQADDEKNEVPATNLRPKPSRASSVRNDAEIVPRSERRGLLSRLTLIPEVAVPYDYTNSTKWTITFIIAIAGAAAPMGSAIVLPALQAIIKEFNASPTIANLSVALYMLAMSIFPLWWSSFSETLGRRTIYILSFAFFVVFGILSAVSTNIAMLIVMRLLSGGAAASVQAVGAGTIADIWEPRERGRAMGMFYIGPLCGPMLSPIIGGAMTHSLGWRSTMWFLVIYGGILEVVIVFCLPETLRKRRNVVVEATMEALSKTTSRNAADRKHAGEDTNAAQEGSVDAMQGSNDAPDLAAVSLHRMTTRQSVHIKTKKWLAVLKRFFIDPLQIILLLRFPAVFILVLYASIAFGSLYFLNISIETTFSKAPYNFSTLIVGLLYIPPSVGYLLSSVFGGRWLDHIMKREAIKAGRYHPDGSGRLMYRPEDRMRENAWLGCFMFPAALIWYGWSVQYHVHWAVPVRSPSMKESYPS